MWKIENFVKISPLSAIYLRLSAVVTASNLECNSSIPGRESRAEEKSEDCSAIVMLACFPGGRSSGKIVGIQIG